MKRLAKQLTTLGLTLALTALPLAACGNSSSSGTDAGGDAPASDQGAAVDPSSWATLGDALAVADPDEFISYSSDGEHYVCIFKSGSSEFRTVSEMDPAIEGKFADLDMGADDYNQQLAALVGGLKLISAEDISGDLLSDEQLAAYVGKTGQELIDEGFAFEGYNFYGGEQTGANMGKGYYSYDVTFDAHVDDDQTEDGGAAILEAKVIEIQGLGNLSDLAFEADAAK